MKPILDWLSVNWADLGSISVSVLAAIFAGFALGHSKGQRDAGTRQAIAAENQVALMRRQIELAEKELSSSGNQNGALPYVPPWMINWEKGDTFSIVNGGFSTEYDIEVELPENAVAHPAQKFQIPELGARSSETFMFAASLATRGREIKISWSREPGGERLSWKGVIPRKP